MALLSHMLKAADATGASIPPIQIESLPASSKNTIRGMTPPVSYTRVHTSTAPQPDAGAMQQKSQPAMGMMSLPKQAHVFSGEDATMNMTGRPLIQDIVKSAMERTTSRVKLAEAASHHIRSRLAEAEPAEKVASDEVVTTEYAEKLASAVEYLLPHVKSAASSFAAARLSETIAEQPEGVSQSNVKGELPGPGGYGHAHHQPPMSPGAQKGLPQEHGQTQMENTLATHVPGEQQLSITGGHGKTASVEVLLGRNLQRMQKTAVLAPLIAGAYGAQKGAPSGEGASGFARGALGHVAGSIPGAIVGNAVGGLPGAVAGSLGGGYLGYRAATSKYDKKDDDKHKGKKKKASLTLVDALREHVKKAADENNPAKISAGPAVPPESSAAGEPGGAPAGGMPVGPRGLVGSNDAAINFKRSAAYANRKGDLKAYLSEPALTNSTDSTLQAAFAHTGEAGTKLASEENDKVAAARELLSKISERVQAK